MTPPKETNKTPLTDPKEMETQELSDKEFRITLLRKFSEQQENTDRKQNRIGKTMHEQNETFNKETANIKQTNKQTPTRNPRIEKYSKQTEEFETNKRILRPKKELRAHK